MRRRAKAVRAAIGDDVRRQAAECLAASGLTFLGRPPGLVSGYMPMRGELDCLPLLARLESDGWRLALPVIRGAAPLEFRAWTFGAPLEEGPHGTAQPPEAPPAIPEVLLVPLLAFSAGGARLGYGGGHYDRTLESLRAAGPVTAIGIAFDEQELPDIPVGRHDEPLNWILTPSGPRAMQKL